MLKIAMLTVATAAATPVASQDVPHSLYVIQPVGVTWLGYYANAAECADAAQAVTHPTAMNVHSNEISLYAVCPAAPLGLGNEAPE